MDNIDYYISPVTASDLTGEADSNIHEVLAPMENTVKHIMIADAEMDNVENYFALMKAYYGGDEEEALKKPLVTTAACPTSPLELGYNSCQVIIKSARLNIPVNTVSMAMGGASSPVQIAGTLVTHNAEVLSAFVLSQLTNTGSPMWYGSSTTNFDMKLGTAPVGSPELALISAGVASLAKYYGLPSFTAGL